VRKAVLLCLLAAGCGGVVAGDRLSADAGSDATKEAAAAATESGPGVALDAGQDAPVASDADAGSTPDADAAVLRGCQCYVTGGLPVTYDYRCPAIDSGLQLTIAWQGNECSATQPALPEPACVTGEACTVTLDIGAELERQGTCL
jgi:hypothetical protein